MRVELKRVSDDVVGMVSNTGPGIAPTNQERIFERFFREDSSRNRAADGFGLGLSLAFEILRAHGGNLWLERSDLEETVFRFRLPMVE